MPFAASEPMRQAGVLLNDEEGVRWRFTERLDWINAALAEILNLKPSALARSHLISLEAGTRQELPPEASTIIRALRNVTLSSNQTRLGGRAINTSSRIDMDTIAPDWHDPTIYPSSVLVKEVLADPEEPKAFYVFPPNNGQGMIEVLLASPHPELQAPSQSATLVAYDTVMIELTSEYQPAVLDYLMYRCLQKEAELAGSALRANQHYLAFANGLGVKLANERAFHVSRSYPAREPAQ